MKTSSGLFALLLIIWSGASTYWYVCKIKHDCKKTKTESVVKNTENRTVINKEPLKNLNAEKKEEKNIIPENKKSDVEALAEKLKNGYTVYNFPKNSSSNNNIKNDFNDFAENLKLYLKANENANILITGHTDNTGTSEANKIVGKKRAEFIKSKLVKKGIEENRISTASEGEKQPVANNDTEEGRRKNRRVVITLYSN